MTEAQPEKKPVVAVKCEGLTKRFGGLVAVDNVTTEIKAGERRGILGPNGAGKTTLFSLINGQLPATSGRIYLFGQDISRLPCHRRTALGLGRTFQITNLFPTQSVFDNLLIASMGLKRCKLSMMRPLATYRELHEKAEEALEKIGMAEKRDQIVANLSHGEHRQIEIGMALTSNPSVLLLDEPMAGLSAAESKMMIEMIQKLDSRITILIIEHDMDAAFKIADRISVLHQGALFAEGSPEEVRCNKAVQEIYLGEE